jgi:hypothetical protein
MVEMKRPSYGTYGPGVSGSPIFLLRKRYLKPSALRLIARGWRPLLGRYFRMARCSIVSGRA